MMLWTSDQIKLQHFHALLHSQPSPSRFPPCSMSRKRAPPPPPSPPAKRHLNSALAAKLQTLRISSLSHPPSSTRSAFGASPSPFLSQSSRTPTSYSTDVSFGDEFSEILEQAPDVPVVTAPEPVPQDMAVEVDITSTIHHASNDDIVVEECTDDDAEDISPENRLIVYRPPVRMTAKSLAKLNSRLPEGRFVFRNPRTDEWIMTEPHTETLKRKLALVPWRGDAKRVLYDTAAAPSKVIPMPWHDMDTHNIEPASNFRSPFDDKEQIMEVDGFDGNS